MNAGDRTVGIGRVGDALNVNVTFRRRGNANGLAVCLQSAAGVVEKRLPLSRRQRRFVASHAFGRAAAKDDAE
ncbi:hypothetical protein Enr13x_00110 [Stieleria neptunia]|uniref:Uncharacterized protein n=1 Tax=Stieleria neptunia TaxID=2527979 RepID=A0A518HH84_9BACT|nr:hypothetical protein Enr13x_00110 [Stieleria neptunia]